MLTTVENLLFLPRHSMAWQLMPCPGQGTVLQLPDGESTGTLISTTDERWKSWHCTAVQVNLMLDGPAAAMNCRELMDVFRHEMGAGGWRLTGSGVSASLRSTAELRILQAMPHSCGTEPGRACAVRWGGHGRIICDAEADAAAVRFDMAAAA